MAQIFGALGIADSERLFASTEGQQLMWEETRKVFDRWNMDLQAALTLFVQGDTMNHKERYELPGGGESQDEDESSGAQESASVKRSGSWDVAYPIAQIGDSLSYGDVELRYLTLGQYDAHVQTILNRNNNSTFKKVLRALLKNTNTLYTDKIFGSLTVVPLANQDGTVYPPVYGSTAEAEANFYIGTAYAESGITNVNDPCVTIRDALEPHYGYPQGGSPIITLCNTSTVPYLRLLPSFDELTNRYLEPGDDVTTLTRLPSLPSGMRVVGVCDSNVIVEWPRMPSGWLIGLHSDAPKPLKRRVDAGDTGLTPGLQMWNETVGDPYKTSRWRNRQGFGVGNRLGAVVIKLAGDGTYTVPAAYA